MSNKLVDFYYDKYKDYTIEQMFNELDNNAIHQLLLELSVRKSKKIDANQVLKKYMENYEYFGNSSVSLKSVINFTKLFIDSLPKRYDTIELSKIMPLGTNAAITSLSQKNILTTIKNSEVCADPTTAITFEACKRRKEILLSQKDINREINLATSTKVLRMQKFDKSKGYLQHFDLFAIISAGRREQNKWFELEKICEHIDIWLKVLLKAQKKGIDFGKICVLVCDIRLIEHFINHNYIDKEDITGNSFSDYDLFKENKIDLPTRIKSFKDFNKKQIAKYQLNDLKKIIDYLENYIISKISKKYPNVTIEIELDRKGGLGYYKNSCFHIYTEKDGNVVPLGDGGVPSWNSEILHDNKEISVVSGIGAELILKLFNRENVL